VKIRAGAGRGGLGLLPRPGQGLCRCAGGGESGAPVERPEQTYVRTTDKATCQRYDYTAPAFGFGTRLVYDQARPGARLPRDRRPGWLMGAFGEGRIKRDRCSPAHRLPGASLLAA